MAETLFGWRDLRAPAVAAATGAGTPSLQNFGPTGGGAIKQYRLAVGDSLYFAAHVDHDYAVGTTAFPHVHWTTNGTDVNTVKWQMTYVIAKGHNQAAFGTDTVITMEEAASGTAWQHMVTEDATGFSILEPDTLIICEVERITNGGSENADSVFLLFVDWHYQVQQYATLNRSPNFYA